MDPTSRLSRDRLAIFLFHGVVERLNYQVRNYTRKHQVSDEFVGIMRALRSAGRALSMDEVIEHCHSGRPFENGAFAITFDDGFENNFTTAAPILQDLGLPATFYVTTQFVDDNAMSWTDRIECCLERPPQRPGAEVAWAGQTYALGTAAQRIRLLDDLRRVVKTRRDLDPHDVVSEIFRQCGRPEVDCSLEAIDAKMSWAQVAALAREELFTVGGHSHRHAVLAYLDAVDLRAEVRTSLELLRQHAGVEPRHYSYPEGLEHCYNDRVIAVLKAHGVVCCPTAVDGVNSQHADLFRLKRINVV